MKYPNFNEEKKLWKKGYNIVVGLDEAGRGCLSGPVVAGAIMIKNSGFRFPAEGPLRPRSEASEARHGRQASSFKNINDSKKLTAKQREYFYRILTNNPQIEWGIGRVSEKIIDKINILEATKLAMLKAIAGLERKLVKNKKNFKNLSLQNSHDRENSAKIGFLILDGNFKIHPIKYRGAVISPEVKLFNRVNSKIPQKSIIKADGKVFSCAAASIIAKVSRDRIMLNYHKKYPQYGFDKHKGYPTETHIKNIEKYGICRIHRKTFNPVSRFAGYY